MTLTLFLDILIVSLLIVGIVYAIVLDNHLSATKENYRLLSGLIEQFYQAAQKTQDELTVLKNTQERLRRELSEEMEKGIGLKEDLKSLLDKIERKSLSLNAASNRNNNRFLSTSDEISFSKNIDQMQLSEAEKELLNALNELK